MRPRNRAGGNTQGAIDKRFNAHSPPSYVLVIVRDIEEHLVGTRNTGSDASFVL